MPTLCIHEEKWKRRITCTGLRLLYVSFNEIAFNMQYTIMLTAPHTEPGFTRSTQTQPKSNSFRKYPRPSRVYVCRNRASLQMKRRRKIWREGSFDERNFGYVLLIFLLFSRFKYKLRFFFLPSESNPSPLSFFSLA